MLRVLVFTDEPIVANGVHTCVGSLEDVELLTTADLGSLLETINAVKPDVLLMDFSCEDTFAAAIAIRRAVPDCKIMLWARAISVEAAYQAMKLGVRGILRKTLGADLLVKSLRTVANGDLWFDKDLTKEFLKAKIVTLTARESQLVTLVSHGLKNKEIAAALSISDATVRVYLSTLFRKLNLKDRYEVAIVGFRNLANRQSLPTDLRGARGLPAGQKPRPQWLWNLVIGKPSEIPWNKIAPELSDWGSM